MGRPACGGWTYLPNGRTPARLQESAHTLMFSDIPSTDEVKQAVFKTLEANGMTADGVHIRLTLTRGEKSTSGMDPKERMGAPSSCSPNTKAWCTAPARSTTSSIRRNGPSYLDENSPQQPAQQHFGQDPANHAGADDAVMLDDRGPAETNATNVFLIRDGVLGTPFGHACLPGITRGYTGSRQNLGIPVRVGDHSLTELHTADEAFTTGTMGGLAHGEVDHVASALPTDKAQAL